jgi:hypothetical protein
MLAITLIPATQPTAVRLLSLATMLLQFVATAILYVNFDATVAGCSSKRACRGSKAGACTTTSASTA